nr:MAG TPA: hypothetical protein [Caudoviricetes sp.]
MIKAEDLRIGDLVRANCNCALAEGTIGTIVEISKETNTYNNKEFVKLIPINSVSNYGWGVLCNNIEGIPLTPEILEKNKFEVGYPENVYNKFIGSMRGLIRFLSIKNKYTEWKVFIKYSSLDFQVLLRSINYVHELQHILWALGEDASLKI